MGVEISLFVERCTDCPCSEEHRLITPDSFEHEIGVFCSKLEMGTLEKTSTYDGIITKKSIFSYSRPSEKFFEIPAWCPFKTNTLNHFH